MMGYYIHMHFRNKDKEFGTLTKRDAAIKDIAVVLKKHGVTADDIDLQARQDKVFTAVDGGTTTQLVTVLVAGVELAPVPEPEPEPIIVK